MTDDARAPAENELLVRLLVRAQRFPWAGAAVAAYLALSVFALPLPLLGTRFDGAPATRAALAVLGATFAAHVVAQAPAWGERIAAVVVGNAVALAFGMTDLLRGTASDAMPAVAVTFAAAAGTLVLPCRPPRPRGIVLAEVAAVGALAWGASSNGTATSPPAIAGALALPLVLGAFVARPESAASLVVGGAALGAALGIVHLAVALDRLPSAPRIAAALGGAALAGAGFGVVAVLARVARSFTAVPRDHPSISDFVEGAAVPSAPDRRPRDTSARSEPARTEEPARRPPRSTDSTR